MSVSQRYDRVSRILHWLTVPLVLVLLVIGWLMVDMPLGLKRFDTVNLHKSLGVLVLLLTLMRLLHHWVIRPAAQLPENPLAARLAHRLLYLCLLGLPLSGWLMSNAAGFGVTVYGTATLPVLLAENPFLREVFSALHQWLGWGLCALLAGHIGAVIWHRCWLKDDVWQRMRPYD
ncbi:cytochrome b [Aliamphritea hakodatensis]|uniref:cytochrome b n=1 Tax=Aliamphritea hakodatensis TaxID=2895352 RepID=UPI0022FD9274|nr:cytochrome b/b6 domain-containing protein [Aliamphritea hakodatensis]